MLVLLDQDGVLADFEHGFHRAWRRTHPGYLVVRPDKRKTFRVKDDYPAELAADVESIYLSKGFYRNLAPTLGAIEGARAMLAAGIDVRICTSPLDAYRHCVLEKYQWVDEHLGEEFVRRMIVTKDKSVVAGDLLIDDNPVIAATQQPVWRHVIFDQPYNRNRSGPRINWQNWRDILNTEFLDGQHSV